MLKPLQTSVLFHRFSFLFVYFSQIIQCWNTCLLFFSLLSFYFCIDSLHAYIYFQFNTENKERKGIYLGKKWSNHPRPLQTTVQQFFSPRQQIYTAKWPGIINPTRPFPEISEMKQARSTSSTKTFETVEETSSRSFTCPDRGSRRTKLSSKWKKGKARQEWRKVDS